MRTIVMLTASPLQKYERAFACFSEPQALALQSWLLHNGVRSVVLTVDEFHKWESKYDVEPFHPHNTYANWLFERGQTMFEIAIITSEPANGYKLRATAIFKKKSDMIEFMNDKAREWVEELRGKNVELDMNSIELGYSYPILLDEWHTWLTAGDNEYEFKAAF